MTIALLLPQFNFIYFYFFNLPILAIQLPQFKIFFFFGNIIAEILFLSLTSVTSFLSPFSYFFSEFWQWCCQNSLLSSFSQINLNSTHITNKLHFLQYSAKGLSIWQPIRKFFCLYQVVENKISMVNIQQHIYFPNLRDLYDVTT